MHHVETERLSIALEKIFSAFQKEVWNDNLFSNVYIFILYLYNSSLS